MHQLQMLMMQMTYTARYEQEEDKDVLYIPLLNSIRAVAELWHLLLLSST